MTPKEAHAWQEVIKPSSAPIADVLIACCVDEDARSFNSQDSPSVIVQLPKDLRCMRGTLMFMG
jgi:hypothetical protein